MKGMLKGVAALALASALFTTSAQAQGVRFGVAADGVFSLEEGGGSDFGAAVMAEFGGSGSSPIGFRIDAAYIFDPEIIIFRGNVLYTFMTSEESKFHPYLLGTAGYLTNSDFEGGDFLAGAGAGFNIMMTNSSITPFVEAAFINQFAEDFAGESQSVQFVDVRLGVKIGSGN